MLLPASIRRDDSMITPFNSWLVALAALCVLAVSNPSCRADVIAMDDASDSAYDSGWGGNGGFGFDPWSFTTESGSGVFVGNAASNGDGDGNADGDINTAGRSWGMFSEPGRLSTATRSFSFGSLPTRSTLRIAMDNGFINGPFDGGSDGSFGFGLRSGGTNRFEFFFRGGDTTYSVNDSAGISATSVGFTDEGLNLEFTLTADDNYSLSITPLGGSSTVVNGTLAATGGIDDLRLFSFSTQRFVSDSAADGFFNSISVEEIPEPSSLLMVALFASAVGYGRFRRR